LWQFPTAKQPATGRRRTFTLVSNGARFIHPAMSDFRPLSADYSVAPQISIEDVAAAKAAGFAMIVNNRPDGEEPAAPQGGDIAGAAAAEGLAYAAIPVGHAGFSHPQLDALDAVLAGATGPVLAYCRSGTRSTHLWALARARAGEDVEAICAAAAGAGYDLGGLRPMLDALAGER
jgi:uncharacterized protein (TIGR01244 family)